VKNLSPELPLLCKDVVPLVVTELPFLSPFRRFIGETAYPFSLGSFGGVGVILLFPHIWTVVFAVHCAFSPSIAESIRDARAGSRAAFDVTDSTGRHSGSAFVHLKSIRGTV
jgi:hypothetical protein